jgi:hypothetical protein
VTAGPGNAPLADTPPRTGRRRHAGEPRKRRLALPARPRPRLSLRLPLAGARAGRPLRTGWTRPRGDVPPKGSRVPRRCGLPAAAVDLLASVRRRGAGGLARRRARGGRCRRAPRPRLLAAGAPRPPLGALSVLHVHRPGLPRLPVGQPARRDRPPRDPHGTRRSAASSRTRIGAGDRSRMAPPDPALPPDAQLRAREAPLRRPDLAESHRADVPLRDPAAPDVDRLPRAPAPGRPPESVVRGHVRGGGHRAVLPLRRTTAASRVCGRDGRSPGDDRRDRQLLLLQPAFRRFVPHRPRRRPAPGGAAAASRPVARRPTSDRSRGLGARARGRRPRRRRRREADLDGRTRHALARAARGRRQRDRALRRRLSLRSLRRDDHVPAGDRGAGKPRRIGVASVRFSLEAGRRAPATRLRRPFPAASRLADVVRGPRDL